MHFSRQLTFAVVVMTAVAQASLAQTILRSHTFDTDVEGWSAFTINDLCSPPPAAPPAAGIVHSATASWTGGCVQHSPPTEGRNSSWLAPAGFGGDWSAAIGGLLSFDMRQSTNPVNIPVWLTIEGAGITLFHTNVRDARLRPVGNRWQRYRAHLDVGGGWKRDRCDGPAATIADFQAVFAAVTRVSIRAEFREGAELNELDNVMLVAPSLGLPASNFDTDLQGWWIVDDAQAPVWESDGATGGWFRCDDLASGIGMSVLAPPAFLGDRSGLIGRTFSIDVRSTPSLTDANSFRDGVGFVSLTGESLRLDFELRALPIIGDIWRTHTVPIRPAPGWTRSSDGLPATIADFQAVLRNLVAVAIRGEYRDGGETIRVDEVKLGSCAPAAVASADGVPYCAGGPVTFSCVASGDGPLTYQWRRNGESIDIMVNPSAATPVLDLAASSQLPTGVFDCVVSGPCGQAVSNGVPLVYGPTVSCARAAGSGQLVTLRNVRISNATDTIASAADQTCTIEDATGALTIFGPNAQVQAVLAAAAGADGTGNVLAQLSGVTQSFNGLFELLSVSDTISANRFEPPSLTTVFAGDFAPQSPTAEALESRLVRLEGYIFNQSGTFSSSTTYTNGGVDVWVSTPAIASALNAQFSRIPTFLELNLTGVFSQFDRTAPFDSFYQLVLLSAERACGPDFNADNAVTVQDIFDFLVAYFTSQPTADINASGTVTVQDIFDFLVQYFAGCGP